MVSLQRLVNGSTHTAKPAALAATVNSRCLGRRWQGLPGTRPGARLVGESSLQTQQSIRFVATCATEKAASTATVTLTAAPANEGLLELSKDTFYPYLEQHADTLVIVDFYTDWCGPCKVIYPQLVKLAEERSDIRIVKFNCNKANKELGVKLGIKVAPTFHLYRNSVKVAEMTGAKLESLVALIEKAQSPDAAESA